MPVVALSIAGSDPSGGAGIQADLKTFQAFGVHGATVVTSLTVQNTTGVRDRVDVAPAFVTAQLDAVLDDLDVAAAKTGLLPDAAVVAAVAATLRRRPLPALVVDPVLVATSGDPLTTPGALAALRDDLLPLATVVTPNVPEAAALSGRRIDSLADMRAAARALLATGARAVLVTGGHLADRACDVLATGDGTWDFDAPRIDVGPIHGTGCTLSASLAACLAGGRDLRAAVEAAKAYVARAIAAGGALGRGSRVLDHGVRPDGPG
jgi:hydroxymethylpyrimidine kinase/phosphomethylpyrimidine kinase